MIRSVIAGKSGSGKTSLLMYLLLEPDMLDYDKLVVCARSLRQPEYEVLREALQHNLSKSQIRTMFESQDEINKIGGIAQALDHYDGPTYGGITGEFLSDPKLLRDPNEENSAKKSIYVFDDVLNSPHQHNVASFFSRGRHAGVSSFYLAQNYWLLDRRTIRENANLFFLFRQDHRSVVNIFQDHVGSDDISLEQFRAFCRHCWSETHSFLTIDLTRDRNCGKYRKNLTEFWTPNVHPSSFVEGPGTSAPEYTGDEKQH